VWGRRAWGAVRACPLLTPVTRENATYDIGRGRLWADGCGVTAPEKLPLAIARVPIHAHPRPARRDAALARAGQRPPPSRRRQQRPGHLHGAQSALPRRRRAGPHRSLRAAALQSRGPQGRQRRHRHLLRPPAVHVLGGHRGRGEGFRRRCRAD